MKIQGVEGMTAGDVAREVQSGAKFVVYQYCISLLVVTLKRSSDIYFIQAGESALATGIGYSLLSVLLGWWGIPWGPIYTLQSLAVNLGGGKDVTKEVISSTRVARLRSEEPSAYQGMLDQRRPALESSPTGVMRCAYCGAQLGPSDLKCAECGAPVRRHGRTLPFAAFVAGGVAIVAVAVVGLYLWNARPPLVTTQEKQPEVDTKAESTPTRATTSPVQGYTTYANASLGFSAEYPAEWQVEVQDFNDPDTGEPLGKVAEFHAPYEPQGGLLQLLDIAVQIIASPEGSPIVIPSDDEYKQLIAGWVADREQELVTEPTLITVDGYTAVQVVYTGTDPFEEYSAVGCATFFFTPDRLFFIEGVASAENESEIRHIYEHFISSFEVLALP